MYQALFVSNSSGANGSVCKNMEVEALKSRNRDRSTHRLPSFMPSQSSVSVHHHPVPSIHVVANRLKEETVTC